MRFFLKLIAAAVQWALLWLTGMRMTSLENRSNYEHVSRSILQRRMLVHTFLVHFARRPFS